MAQANPRLLNALRETARRLADDEHYQWGHMGNCNCGHLARTVTGATAERIHTAALVRSGDWATQALEYCPTSGLEIDSMLSELFALGLSASDIRDLEWLSGSAVLRALSQVPDVRQPLRRAVKEDVALYLVTWAQLLEEQMQLPSQSAERPSAEVEVLGGGSVVGLNQPVQPQLV